MILHVYKNSVKSGVPEIRLTISSNIPVSPAYGVNISQLIVQCMML